MCLLCVRQQAKLGEYKAAERAEWLASTIARAFADPIDAASLSHPFARHGERRLDAGVWAAAAAREAERLARKPRFRQLSVEVTETARRAQRTARRAQCTARPVHSTAHSAPPTLLPCVLCVWRR